MTLLTALDNAALAKVMRQQAASFDRLARLAATRLTVDRVHDLRVLTRRMRSALAIARQTSDDAAKSPETWHVLRIQAKKIRYVLEILEIQSVDRELRTLQKVLGRAHDYETLAARLDLEDPVRKVAEDRATAFRSKAPDVADS